MLVTSDVAHDSRVVREATALAAAGHEVHVQGRDVPADWEPPAGTFTVGSSSGGRGLRPGRPNRPTTAADDAPSRRNPLLAAPWRAARWWLLPRHRNQVWSSWAQAAAADTAGRRFDAVHAHDFNTLALAAKLSRAQDALLVYDAHEWWSGRQRHGRPTPVEQFSERRLEVELAGRADAVVTVSEAIAVRLSRWAKEPATVVRNTFPAGGAGSYRTELPRVPKGVVYAGRIGSGRDLETVLAAAAPLRTAPSADGAALGTLLVGPADPAYVAGLDAETHGVELLPPQSLDEVDALFRTYGLAVVTLTDTCDNHRFALPNKLFHAVHAGVPVVAADLPEIRRTVQEYDLGELYRPGDAVSYADAVRRAAARYPELLRSVQAAGRDLRWETDAERLVGVYARLDARRAADGRTGTEEAAATTAEPVTEHAKDPV